MICYLKRPPIKTIGNYISVSCWKLFEFEKTETAKKDGLKYARELLDIIIYSHLSKPYILTDVMKGFYSKFKFLPMEDEVEVLDMPEGILQGLETIAIADSCYMKEKHGRLVLFADLQLNSLHLEYVGRIKVASFYPMIKVLGYLSYVNFIIEFSVDAESGQFGALHKFRVKSFDGLQVEVKGLWLFNRLVKVIIEATTICYKRFIKRQIEDQARCFINKEMASFTFPVSRIEKRL